MPKVSVCIPAYKQPEYLERCVDSVLMQNFKDYELIITDDTPGNEVANLIDKKYASKNIQYHHNQKPLGTPANWNAAISKANGEYIKLLHHDDFFTQPHSLKTFMEGMQQNKQAEFGFCSTLIWVLKQNIKWVHRPRKSQLKRLAHDPVFLYFKNIIGAPSTTLYKNDSAFTYDERMKWLVDIDFYIHWLMQKKQFVFIPEALVCTMSGGDGQVTQEVIQNRNIQLKEHLILLEKLPKYYLKQDNMLKYVDDLLFHFGVKNLEELTQIYKPEREMTLFLEKVFAQLKQHRKRKAIEKWFYGSRINNYFFNKERF